MRDIGKTSTHGYKKPAIMLNSSLSLSESENRTLKFGIS